MSRAAASIRAGLSAVLVVGVWGPAAAAPPPAIEIALSPRQSPQDRAAVGTIGVELRFTGIAGTPGRPLLRLPTIVTNVDTTANAMADLSARDDAGPLPLTLRTVAGAGPQPGEVEWAPGRATRGAVTVRYAVPAQAALPPRGAAPPLSFSNDGGGVSAAGSIFLPMPPGDDKYRTTVAWNLSAAPQGSRGVSSLGEGRATAAEPLSAGQIGATYFMAGRIGTWPAKVPASGFFGAWQGAPSFDAADLLAWASKLHGNYVTFFGQKAPPPYGVFLRYNPINAGGGVGLTHSFVTTFGRSGDDVARLRITLAHEMFHTFQPYLSQPPGLESSWFGEGLAVFYAPRLALRYGLIAPQAFLDEINFAAARYYTSVMLTVPNSEIPKRFWADTRIRTLPYDRGMLYFAAVDDAVRQASAGKRSLDHLMLAMLAVTRSKPASNADWENLLRTELGPGAVDEFHAFLAGRMPLPAAGAFGPCFTRTTKALRRYELGFDPAVLAEPRRVVRGLVLGSAAAKAGLRDGDVIVVPVPQDLIQGDQTQLLTLQIERDGARSSISYLPRGETANAYQWAMKPGVKPEGCGL